MVHCVPDDLYAHVAGIVGAQARRVVGLARALAKNPSAYAHQHIQSLFGRGRNKVLVQGPALVCGLDVTKNSVRDLGKHDRLDVGSCFS